MRSINSDLSSFLLWPTPFRNPPIEPSDLTTLWHGIVPMYGFLFNAFPTALQAFGRPIFAAIHLYERTSPGGISITARYTFFSKSVKFLYGILKFFKIFSKFFSTSVSYGRISRICAPHRGLFPINEEPSILWAKEYALSYF